MSKKMVYRIGFVFLTFREVFLGVKSNYKIFGTKIMKIVSKILFKIFLFSWVYNSSCNTMIVGHLLTSILRLSLSMYKQFILRPMVHCQEPGNSGNGSRVGRILPELPHLTRDSLPCPALSLVAELLSKVSHWLEQFSQLFADGLHPRLHRQEAIESSV